MKIKEIHKGQDQFNNCLRQHFTKTTKRKKNTILFDTFIVINVNVSIYNSHKKETVIHLSYYFIREILNIHQISCTMTEISSLNILK